jgi:cell division protease FtsH
MVTEYGMSDSLGPRRHGHRSGEVFLGKEVNHEPDYSEVVATDIDAEVQRLLEEAHEEAHEILVQHRATLDRLAEALVERESLDEDDLLAIFGTVDTWEGRVGTPRPPATAPSERIRATNAEGDDRKGPRG